MDVDLIIGGSTYSLSDGTLCRIEWMDGWGEAPLHRLTERGPMQHGAFDKGFRLDPRAGSLGLYVAGASASDLWDKRATLLDYLAPSNRALQLRFTLDNGDVRTFEVHSAGAATLPMRGSQGFTCTIAVQFVGADPTCYDPVTQVVTLAISAGGTGLPVPLLVPITVGQSTLDTVETIYYDGNWRALPVIRIAGPVTSPVVRNVTTSQKLDFTGVTIADGFWYEVNCAYDAKTVVNQSGVSKLAELIESDLAAFNLATSKGGQNDIHITGTIWTEMETIGCYDYCILNQHRKVSNSKGLPF